MKIRQKDFRRAMALGKTRRYHAADIHHRLSWDGGCGRGSGLAAPRLIDEVIDEAPRTTTRLPTGFFPEAMLASMVRGWKAASSSSPASAKGGA